VTVSSTEGKRPERMDETDLREAEDDETRGLGISMIGSDAPGISMGDCGVVDAGKLKGDGGGNPVNLTDEIDTPGL
jgi:hypothetical protein